MPATLVAHEKPISKIFCQDYLFSIPNYQRPYAWTKEQARDLFEDLTGFMRSHTGEVAEMPPYFLGSIVLVQADGEKNAEVVDGQQRLTTLTILLSALRANLPAQEAGEITRYIYERGARIGRIPDAFRLKLGKLDQDFFKTYIQSEEGFASLLGLDMTLSDAQHRIRENAVFFQNCVAQLGEEDRIRLADFIVTRCYLVTVSTPDEDSAFRIFSVLNSRGLNLSATDILKADIIGKIPVALRDSYTDKWVETEEDLTRDGFISLFGHIRMIYRKTKPQGTLLSEFRDHVSKGVDPTDLIDKTILPMADAFSEIVNANYTSQIQAEQINHILRWLGRLEFADWIPPALAFTVRHRNKPDLMRSFVADLERIGYSMLVRRVGINDRIERFSRLTGAIEDRIDLTAQESPLQLTVAEQRQTIEALDGPVYANMSARACSLLLLRLDALVAAEGATFDHSVITVEHVLPQNPAEGSKWMEWFRDEEERLAWTNRLGNLALLSRKKNSAARNFEFDYKKTAYFIRNGVCPFPLTTQVLQYTAWDAGVVAARQTDLVGRFASHWRLR